jgi:hypothetical protein
MKITLTEDQIKMLEAWAQDEAAFQKQLNDIRTQTRLDSIKDENEKARQQILDEFEKQRQEILQNDKLTSDQRTILKLELATQEQQALAAFQQTLDEANAIKEIEKLDAEMVKAENDFNLQKDLLFQKQALIDSQYAADLISQADYNAATESNTDARIELDKNNIN